MTQIAQQPIEGRVQNSLHQQIENLRSERRKYASGIYRIQPERLAAILSGIDRDMEVLLARISAIQADVSVASKSEP